MVDCILSCSPNHSGVRRFPMTVFRLALAKFLCGGDRQTDLSAMDLFFYHKSVTEVPLYNCSAITEEKLLGLRAMRRPLRGASTMIFGATMMLIYIACLRVMVKLALIRKACYKIMFVLGIFEIVSVFINDVFNAGTLAFGITFCDVPNLIYIIGCFHAALWAGAAYLCLYLAFNRIIEILKMRRTIAFFFSPLGTFVGVSIAFVYTLWFMFYCTPAVYSIDIAAIILNPFGFDISHDTALRHFLMTVNNCAMIIITLLLYGVFCILVRKKFKKLGSGEVWNHVQHQVFIQSTLMCFFSFFVSSSYTLFLFTGNRLVILQTCYSVYQISSGLQAFVYLLFNQTILEGVKDDLCALFDIERESADELRTSYKTTSTQPKLNVITLF